MEQKEMICKCCGRTLPIADFHRNLKGVTCVCKDCVAKHRQESRQRSKQIKQLMADAEHGRQFKLSDFTPRELMEELVRRGYTGKLSCTYTKVIDLNAL